MKLSRIGKYWKETPWGTLWAFVIVLMVGAFIGSLLDGHSVTNAIVYGVLIGPGFLAALTLIGLVVSPFLHRADD